MNWSPWMASLNDVLADLYPTIEASSRIVRCAGMRSALIGYNSVALVNWFNILDQAEKQGGRASALLDCALSVYPDHQILVALKRGEPAAVKGPDLDWKAPEAGAHFEKIVGAQSTLLPISFLETGMQRARAVARLVRADRSSGTAFLIGGGWLLTNNHVLPSAESAYGAVGEFSSSKERCLRSRKRRPRRNKRCTPPPVKRIPRRRRATRPPPPERNRAALRIKWWAR